MLEINELYIKIREKINKLFKLISKIEEDIICHSKVISTKLFKQVILEINNLENNLIQLKLLWAKISDLKIIYDKVELLKKRTNYLNCFIY